MEQNTLKEMFDSTGEALLKGYGLTRGVFLCGIPLHGKGVSFDWGYMGDAPDELSKAILSKYCPEAEVSEVYKSFTQTIVSQFPKGNFEVIVNMRSWLVAGSTQTDKHKHAYAYLDIVSIGVNGVRFSKYLDFPNNGIASGKFEADTIEAILAHRMSAEAFSTYQEYIISETTRKSITDDKNTLSASVKRVDGKLYFEGGMGEQENFEGHKASDYEY